MIAVTVHPSIATEEDPPAPISDTYLGAARLSRRPRGVRATVVPASSLALRRVESGQNNRV